MKKRISIIGSVGLPAKYGGWETLVDQLTKTLQGNFDFTVYCSGKKYKERISNFNGAKLVYVELNANGSQSIIYDFFSMLKAARNSDCMLILGVSGCIFLPLIKLISPSKLVVNIDGLEWRRGKWGKFAKWFLKFSEKCAVGFADVVVADNLAISKYIKETYCKDSALIPYGGDQAKPSSLNLHNLYPNIYKTYAFKVCRIEPENNLDIILEAFIHLDSIQLVIVGNWSNSEYGIKLREKYCTFKNMHLLDPVYDTEKLNCLRSSCNFYIHGHSAGGTNPSLLEAMHLSLPIIAFDCEFNRETTENKALFFEDASTLRSHLLSTIAFERSEISTQMKNIANRRYTWEIVSKQYADLFSS